LTPSACTLHPEREAAGSCEYCAQTHCAACLTPFLGRRLCPPCLERIRGLAGAAPGRPGAAGGPPVGPRLPGWGSAAAYFVGLWGFLWAGGVVLTFLLAGARAVLRRPPQPRFEALDASGLGLGLWSLLFGSWAWALFAAVLAGTALFAWHVERWSLKDLGLGWSPTVWRDLLVGLGLAGALFISVVGVGAGKGWFSVFNRLNAVDGAIVLHVGFVLLLPLAALEEVAVRGFLQRALGRTLGTPLALVAGASLFALLHAGNPGALEPRALLGLFLAGLYLGSAYLVTGRLWLPIFVHTGWNLLEGPVFGLPVSGSLPPVSILATADHGPAFWTGGKFGPEAGALLCLLLVLHTAVLWVLRPLLAPPSSAPTAAG
jgi:membrane protease YdiL (CAAX protease family)